MLDEVLYKGLDWSGLIQSKNIFRGALYMSSDYVLAKEIMERMKAVVLADGIDESDPVVQQLFEEERQMNQMNEEVIAKIIREYAPLIRKQ